VLAAAGVLEFVDEQVVNAVGHGNGGIAGQVIFVLEHTERYLRIDGNRMRSVNLHVPPQQADRSASPYVLGFSGSGTARR